MSNLQNHLISFTKITEENVRDVLPFFKDTNTQKFVGDEEWIVAAPQRLLDAKGKTFKYATVTDRIGFITYMNELPFGYTEIEIYDKRLRIQPAETFETDGSTANFVYVVDPNQRGTGLGSKLLQALLSNNYFDKVVIWVASTDAGNDVSEHLLLKEGFQPKRTDTDGSKHWVKIANHC